MAQKRCLNRRGPSSRPHPSAYIPSDEDGRLSSSGTGADRNGKPPQESRKDRSAKPLPVRTLVWLGALAAVFFTAISNGLGTGIASKIISFVGHSGSPLSVNIKPDPTLLMFQPWILPANFPVSRLNSDYQDINFWAPRLGGRPAEAMVLKVSVTALQQNSLTVTGIEAKIVRRSPLGAHTLVDNPGQGGGLVPNTTVGLNLDREQPSASLFTDPVESYTAKFLGGSYFSRYSIDLPDRATHVFEVIAYVQKADVQWDLQIDYVADGKAGHLIKADNGHPFRLVGFSGYTRFTESYLPGYLAVPANNKKTWVNVGKTLCPRNWSPC